MTDNQYQPWVEPADESVSVEAGRMWTGGLATAVVAALVAVVGVLVIRGVFGIPVIAPGNTPGAIDYVGAVWVAGFSVLGALLATALAHVLLLVAPRPMIFFGWIIALATVAMTVWPFSVEVAPDVRVANAALYLLIGISIGSLVVNAAGAAVRYNRSPYHDWPGQGRPVGWREDPPTHRMN
ncbi:hypothetical protein BLA60_08435 [Actinophytocola xinjiangensis]|uniref:Uncharacterized protein n=1 Tax=Actinophytocola xinjiangensis TaxID=485602 RepID=A0A7Z0WQ47_9PSEU|nr:DUF6069 family protein [Actinophytocola xinjiangensis]OLF12044.1 hypothetical protein BLA60_08435 [Actinophytocola xinjiangensis]